VGEGGDGGVAKLIDVPESRIAIFTASASWALLPYLGVVALPRRCCPISAGLLDLGVPRAQMSWAFTPTNEGSRRKSPTTLPPKG